MRSHTQATSTNATVTTTKGFCPRSARMMRAGSLRPSSERETFKNASDFEMALPLSAPPSPPSHSRRHSQPPTSHTYTLETPHSHFPWLTLTLLSSSPTSAPPSFSAASPTVSGSVEIELSRMQDVKDVILSIQGVLHTPSSPPSAFLSLSRSLLATPSQPAHTSALDGTHLMPFSLALPSTCSAIALTNTPLPLSFTSTLSPASRIEYTLSLSVRRKTKPIAPIPGFPSQCAQDTLSLPITYLPSPSPLSSLPNPAAEPHFSRIASTSLSGRLASLRASLSLSQEKSYGLGGHIPFLLALEDPKGKSPQILAAPIAITVDLRISSPGAQSQPSPVAVAHCWQLPHPAPSLRLVRGSIELPADLAPSFAFGGVGAQYALHVRFSQPGADPEREPFAFVQPVQLLVASSSFSGAPTTTLARSSTISSRTSSSGSSTSDSYPQTPRSHFAPSSPPRSAYAKPQPVEGYFDEPPPYAPSSSQDTHSSAYFSAPRFRPPEPLPVREWGWRADERPALLV